MCGIDQVIAQVASVLDSVARVGVACSWIRGDGDLQPETSAGAVTIAEVDTGNRNSCKKLTKFNIIRKTKGP